MESYGNEKIFKSYEEVIENTKRINNNNNSNNVNIDSKVSEDNNLYNLNFLE